MTSEQPISLFFEERPTDSPLIECVWRTHSERAGLFTSVASVQCELVFTRYQGQTHVTLRGPETYATPAYCPPNAEFLGITFRLGTSMSPFSISTFMNHNDIHLPQAAMGAFWLQGAVWQIPSYENAEAFVQRLVRQDLLSYDPLIERVLTGHPVELSPRAIQYRFQHSTGLTHKLISQIGRARQAEALLAQGTPILETVHSLGYFDQAHLTHALRRFIGQTPAQIARTLTASRAQSLVLMPA